MKTFSKVLVTLWAVSLVFTVSGNAQAATAVNLGAAADFAVLGGSTITNTGSTIINGDLGLNPGTSVTGFPPGTVNGTQHITDAQSAQAQSDLVIAYNNAAGQTSTGAISGDLGGQTLVAGVYTSASSIGLTGTLTLDGQNNADSVFVFQAGSTLTTASGSSVNLINGAQACNVFWQVGTSATLGTNSNFDGSILAMTSVTATNGASIDGRLLARNGAVTLDTNTVTRPVCAAIVTPTPIPTPTPTPVPTPTPTPIITPTPSTPTPILAAAPVVVPGLPKTGFGTTASSLPLQITSLLLIGAAAVVAGAKLMHKES